MRRSPAYRAEAQPSAPAAGPLPGAPVREAQHALVGMRLSLLSRN